MKSACKSFCRNTSAHGFKFLTLKKLSLLEKTLWLLIVSVSLIVCFQYSFQTWNEALTKQTITVTDTLNYPIWNYFFPAITICNFNVVSKSRALKFVRKLAAKENATFEELRDKLHVIKYLTNVLHLQNITKDLYDFQEILDRNNIEAGSLLRQLSPTCKEIMQRCTWKGQHSTCDTLFQTVATPDGFCCSFNYFAFNKTKQNLTGTTNSRSKTPRKVSATGYLTALEVLIDSVTEDYFASAFPSYGHKIIVHFPYNFPDKNYQMLLHSSRRLVFINLNPSLYRTAANVNSLSIDKRKCAFVGETKLEYFIYTYENCLSECRGNLIKELCGCIPFYYPNIYKQNVVKFPPICNLRDVVCIKKNLDRIFKLSSNCSCLFDCKYIKYRIDASTSIFTGKYTDNKPTLYGGMKLHNQSVVRVFFDDLVSTRHTTSLRHYWHTVLGNIGGVLTLLIGLSAMTIVEILYFFIIQPIVKILVQFRSMFSGNKKSNLSRK